MKRTDLIETRAARTRVTAAESRRALILAARERLADSRGWIVARDAFGIERLAPPEARRARRRILNDTAGGVLDHLEFYRLRAAPWAPVAVLTDTYAPLERVTEFAALWGVAVEVLARSWHSPDATAVIFTAAALAAASEPPRARPPNVIAFPARGSRSR